jgi:hypothetical protein
MCQFFIYLSSLIQVIDDYYIISKIKFQEKEFVPVEQLKSEKCPRISLQDTLQVMDIRIGM